VDAVAEVLARFHAAQGLGRPAPWSAEQWQARTAAPMRANFDGLRRAPPGCVPPEAVEEASRATEARLAECAPALERRRVEGRAVDGHGDVHLEHVWFEREGEPPHLIDCIEFDEDLRRVDAASEVAFLAMDLAYRGRRDLGERFLRRYAEHTDDYGLFEVVDLFAAYRAAVRAKVAALAAGEEEIEASQREAAAQSARRHLDLARALLVPASPGPLVLVCGTVGVGKSRVAGRLADATGGVVVGSDRTRKRLAGLGPTARAGDALYTPAHTERVYAALRERAAPVVASGRPALIDATFSLRAHREAAREEARRLGARFHVVHVECDARVARERLAARAARGDDPSDAGPDRVAPSRARFEPLEEVPREALHEVRTDRGAEALAASLAAAAEALRAG
jgi:predicted kinase